jgi:quercetin dioxygenase-like cupin family protein
MSSTATSESVVVAGLFADLPVPREATTSRVVVNNPVLRVVAFAMGAGQELTDHSSARAVTVQVVSGTIRFTVDDRTADLVAGDIVYLAPGQRHAVLATSDAQFVLVLVVTT